MEIWTISALGINQIDASNYSFLNWIVRAGYCFKHTCMHTVLQILNSAPWYISWEKYSAFTIIPVLLISKSEPDLTYYVSKQSTE
jgi:hypothetical protein